MLPTFSRLRGWGLMTKTPTLLRNTHLFEAVYPQKSPQLHVRTGDPVDRGIVAGVTRGKTFLPLLPNGRVVICSRHRGPS
jgi:hypothetical protein